MNRLCCGIGIPHVFCGTYRVVYITNESANNDGVNTCSAPAMNYQFSLKPMDRECIHNWTQSTAEKLLEIITFLHDNIHACIIVCNNIANTYLVCYLYFLTLFNFDYETTKIFVANHYSYQSVLFNDFIVQYLFPVFQEKYYSSLTNKNINS